MKGKFLVLFLVLAFLFASGCAEDGSGPAPGEDGAVVTEAVSEETEESTSVGQGEEHVMRLEYYEVVRPSELDIPRGDTISWWSYKRQGDLYVLFSEEGLFEDTELSYSVPFSYTFKEAGVYHFGVRDVPAMNMTVRVS
ncbi:cell surface lipoprotein [Methanosarcina sp. KYL-1]|uniref:cell surface lipoprotein n=1 Tax=Methanosarcina sp. KYL-1 TaxID=2602068 RepID=UPI002100CD15|nr:cell surface lipoprotein [Methanosarcina sp. KYL-1]